MKRFPVFLICMAILSSPLASQSQVTSAPADSVKKIDSAAKTATVDTVKVVVDTVVKKDCYTEYYDIFRSKGAKAVPDGKQDVVIALKGDGTCHCFIGQVEVVGGKIKPPLMIQQENGEFKQISAVGKKLEPAFAASMTTDELYAIKDGMSIVFRTTDQEYGRVFFYKFVNKGSQVNKVAPSAASLITD